MKISVALLVGLCRASTASDLEAGAAHTQALLQAQGLAPMLLMTVQDCQTEDDVLAWESHKTHEIKKFVPKDYQAAALAEMRKEIEFRRLEIARLATPALPIFLASAGNFNTEADLSNWYNQEAAKIQESVPAESALLAVQSLDTEVASLRSSQDGAAHALPAVLVLKSPKNCTTLEELVAWKAQTETQVYKVVPADLQPKALSAVNAEFSKHESRFIEATGKEATEAETTVPFVELSDAAPVPASDQQGAMMVFGAVSCLVAISFVASGLVRRRSQAPEEEAVYMLQA